MPTRRSPNCPAQTLSDAIERTSRVYQVEGRNLFDGARAVKLMGYNGLNGASRRALGSARAFGLILGRGGKLRISDDAVLIIADENAEDQAERRSAMFRSLCHNRVFAELQTQFGSRAPVSELSAFLQKKYGFKPGAATRTAQVYRSSAALVAASGQILLPESAGHGTFTRKESTDKPARVSTSHRPGESGPVQARLADPVPGMHGEPLPAHQVPPTAAAQPSPTQLQSRLGDSPGQRQDAFTLASGTVELHWPAGMTARELEDFTDWLLLEHRKIVREAGGQIGPVLTRKKD